MTKNKICNKVGLLQIFNGTKTIYFYYSLPLNTKYFLFFPDTGKIKALD